MEQEFASSLLENAVNEFAKLPGIGRKTALRLVLHLLKQHETEAVQFGESLIKLRQGITYCKVCHNISESEVCPICSNPSRDKSVVCVVENVKDVMSIENTHAHHGLYHVLGGLISPMDGIGPADIEIDSLEQRVKQGEVKEVILALSATMEGDTTNFYIFRLEARFKNGRSSAKILIKTNSSSFLWLTSKSKITSLSLRLKKPKRRKSAKNACTAILWPTAKSLSSKSNSHRITTNNHLSPCRA